MTTEHAAIRTSEVAQLLGVGPSSVKRWADLGYLGTPIRTPGGHRRYRARDVARLADHVELGADVLARLDAATRRRPV